MTKRKKNKKNNNNNLISTCKILNQKTLKPVRNLHQHTQVPKYQ